jgi:hypothetical protein
VTVLFFLGLLVVAFISLQLPELPERMERKRQRALQQKEVVLGDAVPSWAKPRPEADPAPTEEAA